MNTLATTEKRPGTWLGSTLEFPGGWAGDLAWSDDALWLAWAACADEEPDLMVAPDKLWDPREGVTLDEWRRRSSSTSFTVSMARLGGKRTGGRARARPEPSRRRRARPRSPLRRVAAGRCLDGAAGGGHGGVSVGRGYCRDRIRRPRRQARPTRCGWTGRANVGGMAAVAGRWHRAWGASDHGRRKGYRVGSTVGRGGHNLARGTVGVGAGGRCRPRRGDVVRLGRLGRDGVSGLCTARSSRGRLGRCGPAFDAGQPHVLEFRTGRCGRGRTSLGSVVADDALGRAEPPVQPLSVTAR